MMRYFKTYIFDFDSTIIKDESLDELARTALANHPKRNEVFAELAATTAQGMNGDLTFNQSLQRRLRLFQANRKHLVEVSELLLQRITPSVQHNRDWFATNREYIYVISGGFESCILPVTTYLGIKPSHVYANCFTFDDKDMITGYDSTRPTSQAGGKVAQMAALQLPRPSVIIGDGYTDYEIKAHGEADEFWAFAENISRPQVVARADRVLDSLDALCELTLATA